MIAILGQISVANAEGASTVDFNNDGKVNFLDTVYFAKAYINFHQTPPQYDPICDLILDSSINFSDIQAFVAAYVNAATTA
jgi:hypothetical protein